MTASRISPLQLYLVSLIEGTLFVFFTLASSASLPRIVATEQLPHALGQNELFTSVAALIGPALGPILYSTGRTLPFLVDAISYATSAISLLFIKARLQQKSEARQSLCSPLWTEMGEGVAWLWHHPVIRFLALLTFGLMTPCYGYLLVMITLTQQMHASDVAMGLIFAGEGVGSIAGALVAGPLYRRFGFARVLIGSAWFWAIGWLLYAFAPNLLVLGSINVISFTVVPVFMAVQNSYRLAAIPDFLQGRVNSVFRLMALSSQPLGIAVTGFLLQASGSFSTILVLFIPQMLLCMIATFNKPLLRTMHRSQN